MSRKESTYPCRIINVWWLSMLGTAGRALSEAFIPKIKQVKQTCHRVKTKETWIQPIFINCL